MVVDNISFEGRAFDVHFGNGKFTCKVDGEVLHHATHAGLVKLIRSAVREGATLSIKVALIETDGEDLRKPVDYTPVTIVGTHAGSGNMIVEYDGGRRDQFRRYSSQFHRRLTDAELKDLTAMVKEKIRLERAIAKFKETRQVEAMKLVEAERTLQAQVHSNVQPEEK